MQTVPLDDESVFVCVLLLVVLHLLHFELVAAAATVVVVFYFFCNYQAQEFMALVCGLWSMWAHKSIEQNTCAHDCETSLPQYIFSSCALARSLIYPNLAHNCLPLSYTLHPAPLLAAIIHYWSSS